MPSLASFCVFVACTIYDQGINCRYKLLALRIGGTEDDSWILNFRPERTDASSIGDTSHQNVSRYGAAKCSRFSFSFEQQQAHKKYSELIAYVPSALT